MQEAKPEQTAGNDSGTTPLPDTGSARGRSGPVRYQIVDKDGRLCATFPTATAAGRSAQRCWPNEKQDSERSGVGWDVQVQS